ncbi:hypothetical protein [Actinomadura rubteroloni]|uniref:hypothetical protein n=1 Tax=Actinomadura rubteroloni TaxID=1926885 RepID=UPI001F441BFB|nr:hypothetical protein [Actinomadura rubteroloni]
MVGAVAPGEFVAGAADSPDEFVGGSGGPDESVEAGASGEPAGAEASGVPDEFVVDAFPAGRDGELSAADVPPGARTIHLARLLRWDVYRERLPTDPIRYDRTYVLEDLHPEHLAYLRSVSDELLPLVLRDPPAPPAGEPVRGWLIVHSGPDAEILELAAYALDMAASEGVAPEMTLVAPRRPDGLPPGIVHRDVYPAWPLAAGADRLVTAAGFNAVRQFAPWRERHRMLPFPRTLDDQFARARQARSLGSTSAP